MQLKGLAGAAGRHFDAMAAGEEHAATVVDSARMILINWAVGCDRTASAGDVRVLMVTQERALHALGHVGLAHLSARNEPQLRPQALHDQVRDAARRAVSANRGTKLDLDLHRFNDSLVDGQIAAISRLAVQRAADRGFAHPQGGTATDPVRWLERQAREDLISAALKQAVSALQKCRTHYARPAPPIIYLGAHGRAGFEPKELAAFEPQVAHSGERVRFRSSQIDADGAMTTAETLALRGSGGRLIARYRVDGDGRDYGDEDLIRLGRRHADGRALFDRATWTPPKTKLSLMAMRAMNGGMGM